MLMRYGHSSSLSSLSSSSPLVVFACAAGTTSMISVGGCVTRSVLVVTRSLLTRIRRLIGTRILERMKIAADLFNTCLLLGFAHRLVFLPGHRDILRRWSGSARRRVVRSRCVFSHKHQQFVKHVVRELVNIELDLVFLHTLIISCQRQSSRWIGTRKVTVI